MKKCLILIFTLLIFGIKLSYSLDYPICEERLDNGSNCSMVTPSMSNCSTYNLIRIDNNSMVLNNSMLYLLNGSIYYFNFTHLAGNYLIQLCDNTTREFRVVETYDQKFNKEVKSRMSIAIIIAIIFMMAVFGYLAHTLNPEGWSKVLKNFFLMLLFLMFPLLIRITITLSSEIGIGTATINQLNMVYKITNYVIIVIVAIFMMLLLIDIMKLLTLKKPKKEDFESWELVE